MGRTQNYLENHFTFPLLFCFFVLGVKPEILPPAVANTYALVEKSNGPNKAGLVQCVESKDSNAKSNRKITSPHAQLRG